MSSIDGYKVLEGSTAEGQKFWRSQCLLDFQTNKKSFKEESFASTLGLKMFAQGGLFMK